jgi:alkanesulfonate monooxygenase SsuD/methylene tetrahydromethanopterin reductase-like flavin-dependent oxidoreductase (luciferase family)
MKLGLMSLGDLIRDPITNTLMSAGERHRMMIEAAVAGDRGGLYSINIGEHHGLDYAFSAPPVLLAAIAERTKHLKLSTAVALAANLDAYRLAEDYATVDVISNGRVEIVTGRGNFFESTYALFGQPVAESAARFAESMELLCKIWPGDATRWSGQFRPAINGEALQPRPTQKDVLPFWVGGGSSKETAELAGRLGLKLMLPSAFGRPDKFVVIAELYREAFARSGHSHQPEVGACWHGWVGRSTQEAHARYEPRYRAYHAFTQKLMKTVNSNPPAYLTLPFDYDMLRTVGPAIVGSPQEFIDRLFKLHEILGADLNLIKMDMGGVPADEFIEMIELLSSDVLPRLGNHAKLEVDGAPSA